MSEKLKIGLLDIGECHGQHTDSVISDLLEIVPITERLGFSRYWLGEHHSIGHAWGDPTLLIPTLANLTREMKIGVAGVLLYFHNPLRLAQNYKLLESIYKNRIDLGLARGMVGNDIGIALSDNKLEELNLEKFTELTSHLVSFLENDFSEEHIYKNISVMPQSLSLPSIWMLGSADALLPLAVKKKTNFCLSLFSFQSNETVLEMFREKCYKENFEPECSICVSGVCAETNAKAGKILQQRYGGISPRIRGDISEIKEQLLLLKEVYKVSEIIYLELALEKEARLESYHLLSEAFNLKDSKKFPLALK